MQQRPILFVGESVSLAHVGRPAMLARWTRDAGRRVEFACGERLAHVARASGFAPHTLPSVAGETFYARLNRGQFFYTAPELNEAIDAEVALLTQLRPSLVVSDFRLSLAVSTRLAGVPLLSLINAYWSPAHPRFLTPPAGGIFGALPEFLRDAAFSAITPIAFRTFAAPLNTVRKVHGLPPLTDFREHYCAGEWCAYLDLPQLVELPSLPAGHFFLGPLSWSPDAGDAPDVACLPDERPLAYVTMGSSGDLNSLEDVLAGLIDAGCSVAVSGIKADRWHALCVAIPALCHVGVFGELFSPSAILKRAALTVCHGGSGTIYQSLAHGVPLLCLPGNPDQALASRAAAQNGCALVLARNARSRKTLQSHAVTFLHDDRLRRKAEQISDAMLGHSTHDAWLSFLDVQVPQSNHSGDAPHDYRTGSGKQRHAPAGTAQFQHLPGAAGGGQ